MCGRVEEIRYTHSNTADTWSTVVKKFQPAEIYQAISSFYPKIDLNLIKSGIIYDEKIRNSGNYIYDYAHLFFGKDLGLLW